MTSLAQIRVESVLGSGEHCAIPTQIPIPRSTEKLKEASSVISENATKLLQCCSTDRMRSLSSYLIARALQQLLVTSSESMLKAGSPNRRFGNAAGASSHC